VAAEAEKISAFSRPLRCWRRGRMRFRLALPKVQGSFIGLRFRQQPAKVRSLLDRHPSMLIQIDGRSVMTMLSLAPIGLVGRELRSRGWAGWVSLGHWIHRRVSILCRLQIKRINSHHFDRGIRTRLRRHEDHGRHAAINWERQFLDQFFVGHYLIVSGRQYAIDALQPERLPEEDILAVRTRDHQGPTCIIEKKGRIFEGAWLFNFIQMILAKERTVSSTKVLPIGSRS
jgi:hypothetical protein